LGIAGCQIYALKKVIRLFCMTGRFSHQFHWLKHVKSIQGSVCLTVFFSKIHFLWKKLFFSSKTTVFLKKWQVFFENNNVFF